MKVQKITKVLLSSLVKLKTGKKLKLGDEYFHRGTDQVFYVFTLDKFSIKDIEYFVNKELIFVRK